MLIFGNVLVLALTEPNLRPGAAEFKGNIQYPSRAGDLPGGITKGRPMVSGALRLNRTDPGLISISFV